MNLILLLLSVNYIVAETINIRDVVDELSFKLITNFNESSQYGDIVTVYSDAVIDAVLIDVNGSQIVKAVSERISNDVDMLTSVLQETVENARDLYTSHLNTGCCSPQCNRDSTQYSTTSCFEVCNKTEVTESYYRASSDERGTTPTLILHPSFGRPVNLSNTAVHIPVNVYETDPSVLCFVEWTANLTGEFSEKWEQLNNMHNIRATNFFMGSETGACRFFPASEWTISDDCDICPFQIVDTFDPRNRPWYIDTVAGEKYVIILMDMSGSMTGLSSTLAILSTIELITNLAENDFFLVIRVTETVSNSDECFQDFMRASPENKIIMINFVSSMDRPQGIANFQSALEIAFDKIENSSTCHKIMVIFSDGRASFPVGSFTDRNSKQEIRVFSFLVGRTGDGNEMRNLACRNRGTYREISGFNDVDISVQVFTEELNQPFPITNDYFTQQYTDVFTNTLILTVSMPVKLSVNHTDSINNHTDFIGALGIDLSGDGIRQIVKEHELGPIGYGFIVNNNGQMLAHPLMDRDVLEYVENLVTFDVSQYEFEYDSEDVLRNVRKDLIDGETDQKSTISYVSVEHKRRYILDNFTYYYTPISNISESVAIKLPSVGVREVKYPPLSRTQLTKLNETLYNDEMQGTTLITGNRPNCFENFWYSLDEGKEMVSMFLLEVIQEALSNENTSSAFCNPLLYETLLRDLSNVYNVTKSLGPVSTFFKLTSGLLYCVDNDIPFNCSSLNNINYVALAEKNGFILSFYRGAETTSLSETVEVVKPIIIPSAQNISIGVVGVVLNVSYVNSLAAETINDSYILYLLDEGGYVVGASNGEESNETAFLGAWQPNLFMELVKHNVFINGSVVGYHKRLCQYETETSQRSAGYRITGILISFVSLVWNILSYMIFITLHSFVVYITHGEVILMSISSPSPSYEAVDICLSEITFYMVNTSLVMAPLTMEFNCNGKNFTYQVSNIHNTSLLALLLPSTATSILQDCEENADVKIGEEEVAHQDYKYRTKEKRECPYDSNTFTYISEECSSSHRTQYYPLYIIINISLFIKILTV